MDKAKKIAKKLASSMDSVSFRVAMMAGVAMLCLVVTISWEVIARYFLGSPTSWSMELSRYLLLTTVLLGGAYTLLVDGHVKVDVLYRRFSPRVRTFADLLSYAVALAFCLVLTWQGWNLAWESFQLGFKSIDLGVPLAVVKVIIPIGAFLLGLQILTMAFRRFLLRDRKQ